MDSFDPFFVPSRMVPAGMAYQWIARTNCGEPCDLVDQALVGGWTAVTFNRHVEFFGSAYAGAHGEIEYGGQVLMERSAAEIRNDAAARAEQTMAYWMQQFGGAFSGRVGIVTQSGPEIAKAQVTIGNPGLATIIAEGPQDMKDKSNDPD